MSKSQNLCSSEGCRNKKATGRTVCNKCRMRKWRAENVMKAAYDNLKSNAKRRGKEFKISFEYFEKFCIEEEYLMGKGRTKTSFTIDRDKDELGYVEGNLSVLENSDNVKKEHRRRKLLKWIGQNEFKFVDEIKKDNSDVPF